MYNGKKYRKQGENNSVKSAKERLYSYVEEKGPMTRNMIGAFIAANKDCVGIVDILIQEEKYLRPIELSLKK